MFDTPYAWLHDLMHAKEDVKHDIYIKPEFLKVEVLGKLIVW